jgi:oligoendopeptidase F
MEIAEVASMSMELFIMENWQIYFRDPEDLRRAKIQQLERVITIFPGLQPSTSSSTGFTKIKPRPQSTDRKLVPNLQRVQLQNH